MAEVVLHPKTSALLLQDLQNELIKGNRSVVPLSGAELIANCQKLLMKARAVGMLVIHVRVARRPDLQDAPRPPLGTPPGAGAAPRVYLRRFGITTLILTGYSTTGVVEGALRDARDQDYDCVVVRDCCAAGTVQEHNVCMDIVFPRMAWVASVDEVIRAIRG
jgi:nicotinamidase-related amidase